MMVFFKISVGLIFIFCLACAQGTDRQKSDTLPPPNPAEMNTWYPPDEEELQLRRENQVYLDEMSAAMKKLFDTYVDILGDEIILENLIRGFSPNLKQLEADFIRDLIEQELKNEALKKEVQTLQTSLGGIKTEIDRIQKQRDEMIFREDDYRAAILLFRDGKYLRSLGKFNKVLKSKYPSSLKDNILFGLGSNYFKLKKFSKAIRYLKNIIDNHSQGDKWLASHAVLGTIYAIQGDSRKAARYFKNALKQNPSEDLRHILNRLLNQTLGKSTDARS